MEHQTKKKKLSIETLLIILCWLAYTCSYIGKLSYNANINQFGEAFNVSYADCGLISTFFFMAYGIGQIVNGMLCKRYNIKYVIFISLVVASAANVLLITVQSFAAMKYIWLVNGIAMSFLWTSLIRLLSETLGEESIGRAIVAMGTTVATGTFLVYGMSALFVAVLDFKVTFYVAAAIMFTVSLIWIFSFDKLVLPLKEKRDSEAKTEIGSLSENTTKKAGRSAITLLAATLAFFAVANNFVKDGLTSWTPDILAEIYGTPGWLSILLTLLLPVLAIGGTVVAVKLSRHINDFVAVCSVLFIISTVLIGGVIVLLKTPYIILTVGCFAVVSCLMTGVNNVITSMVPLHLKKQTSSGQLAGVLNGFCYLGSTLSSYGLGAIADISGWNSVFTVLLCVCIFVLAVGAIYSLIKKIQAKGEAQCQ